MVKPFSCKGLNINERNPKQVNERGNEGDKPVHMAQSRTILGR